MKTLKLDINDAPVELNANTVTIAGTEIDIIDGPIGITMSGGADSSLLCYILMKYTTGPIHIINFSAKYHQWASPGNVADVVGFCIDNTGFDSGNVFMNTYFMPQKTIPVMADRIKSYTQQEIVSIVYGATTATPPEEDLKFFKVKTIDYISTSRDPNTTRSLFSPIGYYRPFFNIDKKQIKNMYDELGLTDTLFPITRSCDNPKVKTGHCNGKCWWCEERKWAFGTYE
jgi:7-cyano-7-deazaguanine synthase in queuosine biosynthesis